MNDFPETRRAL